VSDSGVVVDTLILRTRPTTVEARQLTEGNRETLARWVGGWNYGMSFIRWFDRDTGRVVEAQLGDWIVKTAFGHYKPVPDRVIFSEYDRVNSAVAE
jgi:hypothetical protein